MATVNYLYPVNGAAPSQKGSSTVTRVMAQVITGGGTDSTFTITHNFNASTLDLANGWPEPRIYYNVAPTSTSGLLGWSVGGATAVATLVGGTGSAFTGIVTIERPHTIVR